MKINLVSDLHLEFGDQTLPGGEVLILAGDIAEVRSVVKGKKELGSIWRFFQEECAKYDRVIYVLGNHESYHGRLDKSINILRDILPANITVLEDEIFEYNGVVFLGSTLWTDFNNADPITMFTANNYMNDYRAIQMFYPARSIYHRLTTDHILGVHRKTLKYFKMVLEQNANKPVVVVTHMSPSFASVNEKYKNDTVMNGAYASDLSEFILDHPQIKFWLHGHMHDPVDYTIGDTRIISNPRGYLPFEADNGFDVNFKFEIES